MILVSKFLADLKPNNWQYLISQVRFPNRYSQENEIETHMLVSMCIEVFRHHVAVPRFNAPLLTCASVRLRTTEKIEEFRAEHLILKCVRSSEAVKNGRSARFFQAVAVFGV